MPFRFLHHHTHKRCRHHRHANQDRSIRCLDDGAARHPFKQLHRINLNESVRMRTRCILESVLPWRHWREVARTSVTSVTPRQQTISQNAVEVFVESAVSQIHDVASAVVDVIQHFGNSVFTNKRDAGALIHSKKESIRNLSRCAFVRVEDRNTQLNSTFRCCGGKNLQILLRHIQLLDVPSKFSMLYQVKNIP